MVVFRQGRENQRQTRASRVVLEHGSVDGSEEAHGFDVGFVRLLAVPLVQRHAGSACAAIPGGCGLRVAEPITQSVDVRARNVRRELDLVQ
jgi:hypothetical protein